MIALARLPAAAADVLHLHAFNLGMVDGPHPDAEVLDNCAQLGRQQDEWQRLWVATPDEGRKTKADRAWSAYDRNVWPGTGREADAPPDAADRLLKLRPVTPEGLAAMAAAACAMDDAASYSGSCRDDSCQLWDAIAREAAGRAYRPLGAEA